MAGLGSYSRTAAANTTIGPEGQEPGSVNDGIRQLQADIANDYRDREWTEHGDGDGAGDGSSDYSCSYGAADEFSIAGGDFQSAYHVGRAVRITGSSTGTIYGVISASDYDTEGNATVVTLTGTTGVIVNEAGLRVWLSTLSADGRSFPMAALNGRPIDMDGQPLTEPRLVAYSEGRQSLAIDAGAVAWDLADGNVAYLQLTEDVTSIEIAGWAGNPDCSSAMLILQQDGTGGRTVTGYPTGVAWLGGNVEPVISPAAYAVDAVGFMTLDGGAHIIGSASQGAPFAAAIG